MCKEDIALNPKYSIIMPAYNCERTVAASIESVLSQTFKDFELIIVDDGSRDQTPLICDGFAEKDGRVRVIHKTNGGVAQARRTGVLQAGADKILFIDADDTYYNELLASVEEVAKEGDFDLIEYGYSCGGKNCIPEYDSCGKEEFLNKVFTNTIINGTVAVVLWNKVYKKDMLLAADDWGSIILEDYLLNMQYYTSVNNYASIKKPLYDYKIVSGSISRSFNEKVFPEVIRIHKIKEEIIKSDPILSKNAEDNLKKAYSWLIRYVDGYVLTAYIYKNGLSAKQKRALIQDIYSDETIVRAAQALGVGEKYENKKSLARSFYIKGQKTKLKMRLSRIRRSING